MIKLKNMIREVMPLEERESMDAGIEHQYKLGFAQGMKDARTEYERDMEKFPEAVQRGYKEGYRKEHRKRWWDRMNSRMTDLLGRMGSSRLR